MHRTLTGIVLLASALAGCGSTTHTSSTSSTAASGSAPATSTSGSAPAPARVQIAISGYAFHPATITAARGSTLVFSNRDATAHTATTTSAGFDTGTLQHGQSRTVRLQKPGTYAFDCQFHAFMRGTVIVVK